LINGTTYVFRVAAMRSNVIGLYTAASNSVIPALAIPKLTVFRPNGPSTFTGRGTAASPFFRAARIYGTDSDGLMGKYTFTAIDDGIAYVTATYYDDTLDNNVSFIRKNNILQGGTFDGGTVTRSFPVAIGDVITITSDNFLTSFENVSVWAV
jgi:hypothetical protein